MIKKEYNIKNLHCGGCAAKIQYEFESLSFVETCQVDFYKKKVILEINENIEDNDLLNKLNLLADRIEPGTLLVPLENKTEEISEEDGSNKKIILALSITIFIISFFIKNETVKNSLFILAYIISGYDIIWKSLLNIKRGKFLDENFLMTIATIGAFSLGDFSEAAGVMIFYKIGEFFEDLAVNNSKKSIEALMNIKPEYANLKDKNGVTKKVSPNDVKINDIIIVKVGERIPLDGIVLSGDSTIDNSTLTGESLPILVSKDSEILSGSINLTGILEIKVTKLYSQSTITKIIELVENAGSRKAHTEKFITKFARYYTPIVVSLAVFIAFILPLFLGDFKLWIGRSLIFLVISCPCALVLSVPLTFFSSIGRASKLGILIKGGNYLERLTNIDKVIFDKTGTLTKGKFSITKIELFNGTKENLLEMAKAGEFYSNHPIGKAILNYGDIEIDEWDIEGHNEKSGYGVITRYKGNEIIIGNSKFMKEYNISFPEETGIGTVVYVATNDVLLGKIYVNDTIKQNSIKTLKELNDLNIETYMLTGDNDATAQAIGKELGINKNNVYSQLLPQDKISILEKLKLDSKKGVIFVGDGINDAPALAISDVGISMGKIGSDIAVESSDIVLMNDDPYKIIESLKIAKLNKNVVWQNIVLALGIKIIVMILGILGLANLWMAIFADVGVSIIAVINASKLLRNKR